MKIQELYRRLEEMNTRGIYLEDKVLQLDVDGCPEVGWKFTSPEKVKIQYDGQELSWCGVYFTPEIEVLVLQDNNSRYHMVRIER